MSDSSTDFGIEDLQDNITASREIRDNKVENNRDIDFEEVLQEGIDKVDKIKAGIVYIEGLTRSNNRLNSGEFPPSTTSN